MQYSSDTFTVGIVQERCPADYTGNIRRAQDRIREAHRSGASIVCLSELFSSPYFCSAESHSFFDLAEQMPAPTVAAFQPLARELNIVIIVPFFEKRGPGVYHNSTAVIDASGEIAGVYRKMHIPDDPLYYEKFYFTPGDAEPDSGGFRVFETRHAKIGVLICWDQWYPEAARITSLMGAEVLFYPTAIGWHPKEKAQYGQAQVEAWRTMQRSHAIANGIYVAAINRIGFEPTPGTDGLEFFGNSFIADPSGQYLVQGPVDEPAVLVAKCDRRAMEDFRRNWPFLRDRRIDAYKPILKRLL